MMGNHIIGVCRQLSPRGGLSFDFSSTVIIFTLKEGKSIKVKTNYFWSSKSCMNKLNFDLGDSLGFSLAR